MNKLIFCKKISRRFFAVANGCLLISAMVMSSCDNADEQLSVEPAEEVETEFAFFDPSDTLNITACEAEDIATAFMDEIGGVDNTFKSKGMRYSCRKTTVIPDNNREPALYAINLDPDGYCIVAATKKTETILAYSDQGKFDLNNLPDGLAEWMAEKIEIIQNVRGEASIESVRIPKTPSEGSGMQPLAGRETGVKCYVDTYGPLLKTEWGQDYPFNMMCPDKKCYAGDKYCKAGCVAIAAAQIVRYYQPIMVYNFNPYYWNDMPNTANTYGTDESIRKDKGFTSMARLIHDIGVAVDMDYGCESSRAETEKIPGVLSNKFGFFYGGNYQELSNSKATPKLINNIIHKQPVIMAGYRTKKLCGLVYENGHAWVCDGYKKVTYIKDNNVEGSWEYFHMNWGWGGKDNGWFTLDLKLYQSDYGYDENKGYIYKKRYITDIKYNANAY